MRIIKQAKSLIIKNWFSVAPENQERIRISVIIALIMLSILLNVFCHAVFKSASVFSHFFYIPIILSSLWWRRRGVWTAALLSCLLIISGHVFLDGFISILSNYIRSFMFMLISFSLAILAEERDRNNRALSALCSIYTAFNTSEDLQDKMRSAIEEIKKSLPVNGIAIFILEGEGIFRLKYSYGIPEKYETEMENAQNQKIMNEVAEKYKFIIFDNLNNKRSGFNFVAGGSARSTSYSPIISNDQKVIGIIQLFSPRSKIFSSGERNILELIGNRIGSAIENSFLYDIYKKSEEKYKSLFNSDPNPIFILDSADYKIIDVNSRAIDCYGYKRDEMLNRSFLDLGEDVNHEILNSLKNLKEGCSIFIARAKHHRSDGAPFYVNINVSNITYREGQALIATTTNVNESVHRDMQLIQAGKMTTVGTMAAGMAHELSQPLNVIMIGSDFILKKAKKSESISSQDFLTVAEEISVSVQRAAQILKHMRDFSRQSDIAGSPVNINNPIRDVFKILGQQLRVHGIEVTLDLTDPIPQVFSNHNRMEQVFLNLITNAMDAMDEKILKDGDPGYKKIINIRSFASGSHVVVTVSDNGIGIPEENIGRIFEPFFTTKETGKGTGLGTSISYGIVRDYGGTIEVHSKVSQGTTFELRFPFFKA